ncbi:MAG: FG-GAP repeat protein [Acidobacteria bacterium]|nr:FG-GAP repeat protein [Acidobacteriota bacterium]
MRKALKHAVLWLTLAALAVAAAAQENETRQKLPTLRGAEAVERLRQAGQYDDLIKAVETARIKSGATEDFAPAATGSFTQTAKLTAADGAAGDRFGLPVAVSGDTAVVGAAFDTVGANANQGSAYVFTRSGTVWSQQAKLTADDGAANDYFGTSVAIDGETIVVGAYFDDVGANANQGSAYVFTRSGTTWTQQTRLTAADGAASDLFGLSVAVSGGTAIVGSYSDTVGANAVQGSAYVFTRAGTVWTQQAQLTAADGAAADRFGNAVALSGDTALVGASLDDVGATGNQGSAYVFTRSGTVWTQQAQLVAADGAAGDYFGNAVALSGDTALVGAYADDVAASSDLGAAYVFTRSGSTWSQQAKLLPADGAAGDNFGTSVALDGETAVVGAIYSNVGANADQGAAYVFNRAGAVWTQQTKLAAADGIAYDYYGRSVAISGSVIVAGCDSDDVGANADQGSAYIFRVLGSSWSQEALKVAADGAANDQFGYGVAISGDTAIVGTPYDDVGANANQGSVYVFTRAGTAWTQQAQLTADDGAASDYFGNSVAISGETALIGAFNDDVGANGNQGSAYVFTRAGTVWTQQAKLTAADGANSDWFGQSVAISGETALVSAHYDDVGANADQGSAYVFTRSGAVWSQQAKLTAADGAANDVFGYNVALDGQTALVGAYGDDVGANADQGSAYVFTRSGTVWSQQAKLTAADGAASDLFGFSVAISGETALVGDPYDTIGGNTRQGSAYVFTRSGATWTQQQKLTAADGAASDMFGFSVGLSGDTAVVGAYLDDVGANANQGSAYVFMRSGNVWSQTQKLTATGGAAGDFFGYSAAISGDKIVIGAILSDASASNPIAGARDAFAPQATDQGAAFFFVNQPFAPTAATVAVSGRVLTPEGAGLRNAIVYLIRPNGATVSTRTTTFGFYHFDDVEAGQTVTVGVVAKHYQYAPQTVAVGDGLTNLDFSPE